MRDAKPEHNPALMIPGSRGTKMSPMIFRALLILYLFIE
jgi:hypothetical protein